MSSRPYVSLRTLSPLFVLALAACAADHEPDAAATSAFALSTQALSADVSRLVHGPADDVTMSTRQGGLSRLDTAHASLSPVPNRTGYLAPNGVSFSFSGSPGYKSHLSRKDANGADVELPGTFYSPVGLGFDTQYFYWVTQLSDYFYGGRYIYRIGLAPGATPEEIGDVGNGANAPDPLTTLVAEGSVYWTTLPGTCSLGSGDSCWEIALGQATGPGASTRVKPRLADGTYVSLAVLAAYGGDLYAASSKGVYKLPGGNVGGPLQKVCDIPSTFPVKLANSTFLAGVSRAGFAVSPQGFVLPLQSEDYRSALGLVKWDCSPVELTSFGPPATGSVRSYGLTQIADIVVRGRSIFWLDRQLPRSGDDYADSYYALKLTTF